ncbi:hypothetical protein WMY93_004189 [Mugilogobius chulae]|uniref:EMI domain-containing protein n=1 Tax=Mugilogobius chulae TaxID=88201 RepID=A0AAW0PQD7_9GOBI
MEVCEVGGLLMEVCEFLGSVLLEKRDRCARSSVFLHDPNSRKLTRTVGDTFTHALYHLAPRTREEEHGKVLHQDSTIVPSEVGRTCYHRSTLKALTETRVEEETRGEVRRRLRRKCADTEAHGHTFPHSSVARFVAAGLMEPRGWSCGWRLRLWWWIGAVLLWMSSTAEGTWKSGLYREQSAVSVGHGSVYHKRNWCPHTVTKTVSCQVQNGTLVQRVYQSCRWPQSCSGGSYRTVLRPSYKVVYRSVTSLEWKCCPGFSGAACTEERGEVRAAQEAVRKASSLRKPPARTIQPPARTDQSSTQTDHRF